MSGKGGFGGCLAQIIALGVILAILGIVDACQRTQSRLIKEARKGNTFYHYQRYLDEHPDGKYSAEAYDSLVSLWDAMDFCDFQDIPLTITDDNYFKSAINKYEKLYAEYPNAAFRAKLRGKLESKCREQYDKALQLNTFYNTL